VSDRHSLMPAQRPTGRFAATATVDLMAARRDPDVLALGQGSLFRISPRSDRVLEEREL
jgi:hypothetical protein